MSVKLEGVSEVRKALAKYAKRYPGETARALYTEGFGIQQAALPLTPVEFAVLRTSAYTTPPTGPDKTVEVGYGTEYAVYQHERMNLRHPRGGQAKYLETAINMRRAGMLERLGKRIQQNIEAGESSESITPLGPTRPRLKVISAKTKSVRRRGVKKALRKRRKRRK